VVTTARYVVTGCAGFIGSQLTEALLAAGDSVLGVDAFTDYYPRELKERNLEGARSQPAFRFVEADLAQADLTSVFADVDGVFHLAAQPGVRASWGEDFAVYARNNVIATQRVFDAAASGRVRVVWASSSSVYGEAEGYPTSEDARPRPVSPYGVTKLTCEHLADAYAINYGLDAVGLRYFTVYGPRQRPDMAFARLVEAALTDRPFPLFGTGEQSRDVTYVEDAVDATIAAMARGLSGETYNVGGGNETTLRAVIELCEELSGRPVRLDEKPRPPGDVARTAADIGRARTVLGWSPRTGVAEGVEAQLVWARGMSDTNAS
jgi:nucleoside-diphosphate-sugar epimerase